MSSVAERGSQVDAAERLYRGITTPVWWVADERRPSSAAFDEPKFSVNIASLTTVAETARQLREDMGKPNAGIISFACGRARELGFNTHLEADENYLENEAHAHVYYDGSKSSRKKRARTLASECNTELEPTF